ncbi:MAG: hypothetical protein DWI28_06345 [Planctomycetota bacterium]|nr:MAG: hypothetical protein DWI28_06345 [Planctomycetota bacterium]
MGAEALWKISQAPLQTHERFLLGECVRAYLPLGPEHRAEYDNLLATETFVGVKAMNKTFYEEGIEEEIERGMVEGIKRGMVEGIERGMRQELLDCAINGLEGRFGPLPAKILADLKSLSRQELMFMLTKSYRITSLDALDFDGLK